MDLLDILKVPGKIRKSAAEEKMSLAEMEILLLIGAVGRAIRNKEIQEITGYKPRKLGMALSSLSRDCLIYNDGRAGYTICSQGRTYYEEIISRLIPKSAEDTKRLNYSA